jgi:hypothetical protein
MFTYRMAPFHQSNLFWGSVSAVFAIVIAVVVAMIKDVRWLLIFAWPFATLAVWEFARTWGLPKQIKWLTGSGSVLAGVGLVALYLLLAPATSFVPSIQTQQAGETPPQQKAPVLHRRYETNDRARLQELLFNTYTYLSDTVSPLQLEIFKKSEEQPTEKMVSRLSELRDTLKLSHDYLDDFSQRNSYYRDEITDVLTVSDPLNADIMAIDNYIAVISASAGVPQDRMARITEKDRTELRKTNTTLGNWISECLGRINAKRDALQ